MKRKVSIRQDLFLGLTLLVLFTSGAILISTVIGAFRASEELTRKVIDEAGLLVTQEVDAYFKEVERSLRIVSSWVKANDFGPGDGDRLVSLLQPLIAESPRVSSILLSNSAGAELMILQDPIDAERWTMRLVDPRRWQEQVYIRRWHARQGIQTEGLEFLQYHTKSRTYYKTAVAAVANDSVAWTPPSIFFTTRDPGMTATTRWSDANGDTTVLAFDVLLLDVSRMTASMEISKRGIVFVLSDEDPLRVVGLPGDGDGLDDEAIRARLLSASGNTAEPDVRPELPVAGKSGNLVLDAAALDWENLRRTNDSLRFKFESETWWANFSHMRVGDNALVVGAVAPESDFLTGLSDAARRIALVSLLAVVLATILATRMTSSFARPLEALAKASRRIQELDLSPPEGIDTRVAEIQELVSEQERTRVALDSFARYLPVEIVRDLVARGVVARIGGERRIITILFTDIEGFTTIAENSTAEEVTALLTDYFETLLETIRAHGGEVNQLLGDGVVAYWGAPVQYEDHAARAVAAILECQERVTALSERFVREGKPALPTRFGVASGEVMIGNMGSNSRLAYSAIGDTANLASRIEGLDRFYGTRLLVSGKTRDLAGDEFEWREVDAVRVKGRTNTSRLFQPLGRRGELSPDQLDFRDRYEAALRHYREGEFEASIRELEAANKIKPGDRSVERLRNLAEEQLQEGATLEDWDGVTTFQIK